MSFRQAVAEQVISDEAAKYAKEREHVWKALEKYLKTGLLKSAGITAQTPIPSKMEKEAWYFRVEDVNFRVKFGYENYEHAWYVYAKMHDQPQWKKVWNPSDLMKIMNAE